jgi:hypothetical protein
MTLRCTFGSDRAGLPIVVVDGHPGLTDALADAVGAWRPSGVGGGSISTDAVDRLVQRIEAERASGAAELVVGNETRLVLDGDEVVAEARYEQFESERVAVTDVVDLLRRYRVEIGRVAGGDDSDD